MSPELKLEMVLRAGSRGDHYCAVHVSPDDRASYASVETDWPGADREALVKAFRAAILAS